MRRLEESRVWDWSLPRRVLAKKHKCGRRTLQLLATALGIPLKARLKNGKWVGQKAKIRVFTPRTGATAVCLEWLQRIKIGATFRSLDIIEDMGIEAQKVFNCTSGLVRRGVIERSDKIGKDVIWKRLK